MRERALRWALLLHPRAWRERYGDEVYDLSKELLAANHMKWPRIVLGLLGSAMVERVRSLLRMGRLAGLSVLVAALVTIGAIALAVNLFGPGGSSPSTPSLTAGTMPLRAQGGAVNIKKVPDFVATLGRSGKLVGYIPRANLFPATRVSAPASSKVGGVAPVYARDLKTLVGHMYPGVGFVPLGRSPASEPCIPGSMGGKTASGTTYNRPIACPSTIEVVPNLLGMYTPTAMGALSGASLQGQVSYVHSRTVADGYVVSVSPSPGTKVHARSEIKVVSSIGPSNG